MIVATPAVIMETVPARETVFSSPGAFKLVIGFIAITSLLSLLSAIAVPKADGATEDDIVSSGAA